MTYTFDGSEEGYAALNTLRENVSENISQQDPFEYFRAYENFLFPNDPTHRSNPEAMLEHNAENNCFLGKLTTLQEREISQFSKLTVGDKVKLAMPFNRYANIGSIVFNTDPGRLYAIVETLLDNVESQIVDRIGGTFAVVRVNRLVTRAGANDKSAKWHFDPVPCGFFKIFAYLNGPESHDGATEFLDGGASSRLIRSCYHLVPAKQRSSHVAELFCSPSQVYRAEGRGGVFLFNPGLTAHRGHYPSFGRRDVLEISILKSPVGWRDSFDAIYKLGRMTGKPAFATWPRWIS